MIATERLDLVPASLDTVRAALQDSARLGRLLHAEVPSSWPPELLDRDALEWVLRSLQDPANDPQWGMYWIVLRQGVTRRVLVGTAGFKGKPSADGTVEVGYGVVPEYQRRGYASESVRGFLEHAFANPRVNRVIAETLPSLDASVAVMTKCGMRFIGDGSLPGVIRYELRRSDWRAST
jgi:ribosomal-protein-alanine N-acetyltransferase